MDESEGVRLVVGCRLDLEDGTSLLVYPTNRAAYSRLCRLLSIGKGRPAKGACKLIWEDVVEWGEGLIVVLVPGRIERALTPGLSELKGPPAPTAQKRLGIGTVRSPVAKAPAARRQGRG